MNQCTPVRRFGSSTGYLGHRWRWLMLAAAIIACVAVSLPALADDSSDAGPAKPIPCATSITACGCTITKAGLYEIFTDLTSASGVNKSHDCIDVNAANVVIAINTDTITGPGGGAPVGVGIHLMKKATNAAVFAFGAGTADITGWADGIEDDTTNAMVDNVDINHNTIGMFFNNATNGQFNDSDASNNTNVGVLMLKGKGNTVNDCSMAANDSYGVWFKGAVTSQVRDSNVTSNGRSGIYIGCSSAGPIGAACSPAFPNSIGNRVHNTGATSNPGSGIAIDLGDTLTLVSTISGGSNTTFDLLDENPSCDHNLWFGNSPLLTRNKGCID